MDEDKAFDAVESYLCDAQLEPGTEWRTVSLVTALLGIVSHGPEFQRPTLEARRDVFKDVADELSRRGLDGLGLVRYGMFWELAGSLLAALIVKLVFGGDLETGLGIDVQRWSEYLELNPLGRSEEGSGQPPTWFEDALGPAVPRIYQWATTASLDDLVNLTPPSLKAPLSADCRELPDRPLRDQYRWAVDHFAKTFFRDWTTTSLHYELRWLDGDILPPCPNELMMDRKVSREEITREIARRAVYNERPDPGETLVSEMSQHALKLLKQGRYREAAAVFEFGVQQRPEDSSVQNNLGFCLIPVDVRDALKHLKSAVNMGYYDTATNTYNQMCCYVEMGRSRAALNIAETESRLSNHSVNDVLLWQRSSSSWELISSNRPFECVARFAVEISRSEGWKEQEQYWASMLEQQA